MLLKRHALLCLCTHSTFLLKRKEGAQFLLPFFGVIALLFLQPLLPHQHPGHSLSAQTTLFSEDYADGVDDIIDGAASSNTWTVSGGNTTASNQNPGATWQSSGVSNGTSGTIDVSADVVTSGGGGGSKHACNKRTVGRRRCMPTRPDWCC